MSVELTGLRLPLAPFTLEADASLGGRVTAIFAPGRKAAWKARMKPEDDPIVTIMD